METLTALPGKMQMISTEGIFFSLEAQRFVEELKKYSTASSHYTVVSIIGPQSSGKSYLLNTLFRTNFEVLSAGGGRKQTTKGIWIAKCINPCMIIMDVEGLDGRERGEDDTLFERRSALFALTVSDVLLLNMWYHDIGRLQGASIGLIKLIFEERVHIEAPKTTIIIVVRDHEYDETSSDITKKDLERSMNEIWHKVHPATTNRTMSDYIEIVVKDFPHKNQQQEFSEKSKELAQLLCYISGNGSLEQKYYASSFAYSSERIWNLICCNKRVTAADHKMAMSAYVCNEMKNEILDSVDQEKGYGSLMSDTSISVKNFNVELLLFLKRILDRYEEETRACDENVRDEKKAQLEMEIVERFQPTFNDKVVSLFTETLSSAQSNVYRQLKKLPEMNHTAVIEVIRPYITDFDSNTRADLHAYCEPVLNKHREELVTRLTELAEEGAHKIQVRRNLKGGAKIAFKIAIGTAWAVHTFDPSIVGSGLGSLAAAI